jgi:hypothetical protein
MLTIPLAKLYTPAWKLEATIREVRAGKRSYSSHLPLRVSRLDSPRGGFFILDGNHRAVEAVIAGKSALRGIVDEHIPYIERTGGAHRDAVASIVQVKSVVLGTSGGAKHERGGNPHVSRAARDMTLKARVNALVGRKRK